MSGFKVLCCQRRSASRKLWRDAWPIPSPGKTFLSIEPPQPQLGREVIVDVMAVVVDSEMVEERNNTLIEQWGGQDIKTCHQG